MLNAKPLPSVWAALTGLLVVALLIWPGPVRAQTSMGGVSGTVTDSTGAVVPGATVTLVNESTDVESRARRRTSTATSRSSTCGRAVRADGRAAPDSTRREVAPFTVGVNETVARNVSLKVGAAQRRPWR